MKTLLLKITAVFVMCIFTMTVAQTTQAKEKTQAPTTVQLQAGGDEIMIPAVAVTTETQNYKAAIDQMENLETLCSVKPVATMIEKEMVNTGVGVAMKEIVTQNTNTTESAASIQKNVTGGTENLKIANSMFTNTNSTCTGNMMLTTTKDTKTLDGTVMPPSVNLMNTTMEAESMYIMNEGATMCTKFPSMMFANTTDSLTNMMQNTMAQMCVSAGVCFVNTTT